MSLGACGQLGADILAARLEAKLSFRAPRPSKEVPTSGLGGDWVGCIAGALSFSEYSQGLASVGFESTEITPTDTVADGMHAAIIRAVKSQM